MDGARKGAMKGGLRKAHTDLATRGIYTRIALELLEAVVVVNNNAGTLTAGTFAALLLHAIEAIVGLGLEAVVVVNDKALVGALTIRVAFAVLGRATQRLTIRRLIANTADPLLEMTDALGERLHECLQR